MVEDIPDILSMYSGASAKLKEQGIDQWQNNYPNEVVLRQDIASSESYVLVDASNVLASAMISSITVAKYATIQGQWSHDLPYHAIHRFVVNRKHHGQGLAGELMGAIKERFQSDYFRIDTHADNVAMRQFLVKQGFKECGTIILEDGSLRLGYDLCLI